MDLRHTFYISLVFILTFVKDVSSLSVTVSQVPSTSIEVGNTQVQFSCTYALEPNDRIVYSIEWQREIGNGYQGIAVFSPPGGAVPEFTQTSAGDSFKNRSTLTKPETNSLTAVLTVNEIECEDDGKYRCFIPYRNTSGSQQAVRELSMTTIAPADAPYTIPTMSKSNDIVEADSVTFTCRANIGKPQGDIRWWIYRAAVNSASELSAPTPSKPPITPGVCEYNVTSTLTVTLTKDDNQAVIRCSVDQDLVSSPTGRPEDKLYAETAKINVFYKVRVPEITKQPQANEYQVGQNLLTLSCSTIGNPNPATATDKNTNKFTWYYKANDGDNETMAVDIAGVQANDGILRLTNLQLEQAGIYICEVQNGFNGQTFSERNEERVTIVKTTTTSTTTPRTTPSSPAVTRTPSPQGGGNDDEGLGGGIIAGIVIACILVIMLVVLAVYCCVIRRNRGDDSIEEPSEKPKNNKLNSAMNRPDITNDKNSAFYQGNQFEKNYNNCKELQYADLTFDNKPGSRKPIQIYDIDNNHSNEMDHGPYSQVMMPSV